MFEAVFFGYNQYWPDGFMVLCPGAPAQKETIHRATIGPLAKRRPNGVSLLRRADSGPRLDDGWAKAQPTEVLILKRLRK